MSQSSESSEAAASEPLTEERVHIVESSSESELATSRPLIFLAAPKHTGGEGGAKDGGAGRLQLSAMLICTGNAVSGAAIIALRCTTLVVVFLDGICVLRFLNVSWSSKNDT
jgi:hypothetical protein